MAIGAPATRRPLNPLEDPLFQPVVPPINPAAPMDTSALLAQQDQAFPPLADVESYGEPPPAPPIPADEPPPTTEAPAEPPPAAPPATAGPGGMVKTETERVVLSPESKAALERGKMLSGEQGSHAGAVEDARRAKILADQEDARVEALAAKEQIARDLKAEEDAKAADDKLQADYAGAVERWRLKNEAAEKRVDAANAAAGQDYWADKSTGFKIISALLTGSSIKSSYTLGEDPNNSPFMKMSREAIERDKERKLSEVRASKEFLEAARKGPEEARQFMMDAKADIQAGTGRQLAISLKRAEAMKAGRKVDPARLQSLSDALLAEEHAKTLATQQEGVDQDLRRGALTNRKQTTTVAPMTAAQMKAAQPDNRLLVRWNGRDYSARNLPDGTQLRKKAGASTSLLQKLDAYAAAVERIKPGPTTHGKELSELTTAKGKLLGAIKEADELGALDKGVRDLVDEQLSDPTSIKTKFWRGGYEGTLTGIRSVREGVTQAMDNALTAQGNDVAPSPAPATASAPSEVSVADLRMALKAAGEAGDKKAVAQIRAELARKGK